LSTPVFLLLIDDLDPRVLDLAISKASVVGVVASVRGKARCEDGFDAVRGQWRADTMLSSLAREDAKGGRPLLVLTGRDLYVAGLNFVFGLARKDLLAAVVSWHRLADRSVETFGDRLAKEMVHEVGHLEGLAHCSDPSCVMWFSNTLRETDRKEVNFCHVCTGKRGRGRG
jgi:archaemetzincin